MNKLNIFFSGIAVALLFACGNGNTQESENQANATNSGNGTSSVQQMLEKSMNGVEATKYHEYVDPNNGLVQTRYPIPKSWKVNSTQNPIYIEGPNNLKIYKTEVNNYVWSNDPMMQQTMQMSGKILAQPLNNQQILNQYVRPNAESQGYNYLKSYKLPELSGLMERLIVAMPNTGTQRLVEALGTEWKTPQGKKSLIVLLRYQIVQQQSIIWSLQTTEMETDPAYFEEAKNAYVYSWANAQLNPQWIQHMNGQLMGNMQKNNDFWAKASAQSSAAHRQRMNAIAARSATAQSVGNTYSDILDISHKGYLNRSNINSAGHDKSVQAITQSTLIGNHETGEHYEVPSGANFYWVSEDGFYVGTNNALLDPNSDNRLNDKNWTKFASEQ